MAVKQGGGKSKRTPKKSKGIHGGGGKVRLSAVQKALINDSYLDVLGVQRRERIEKDGIRR